MKKVIFTLLFCGIPGLALSFLVVNTADAGYVYDQPWICDESFDGYSADWWCGSRDNCEQEDYDFCVDYEAGFLKRSFHFGCRETGPLGVNCVCDVNETSYEDCSGDCINGLCAETKTCTNLGGVCCPAGEACIGNHWISEATDCGQCCDNVDYCRVVSETCEGLSGTCCFPGQVCTSGKIIEATDCDECCSDADNCVAKSCSLLGGICCDSGYECIMGKISGASDCEECCTSRANCKIITGTCTELGGKCCPFGQICPYYSKLIGATDCDECCKAFSLCSVSPPKTCSELGGSCCSSGKVCTIGKLIATDCLECCSDLSGCRTPLKTCTEAGGECCPTGQTCTEGKLEAKDCECCSDVADCKIVTVTCADLGGVCCSSGQTCGIGKITEAEDCECCSDIANCSDGGGDGGDGGGWGISFKLINPLYATTVTDLIDGIINFIWYIAIVFAPIMFLVGGYTFLTSGGDPEKLRKGKNIMMYAAIGLAIVLVAKGLIALIKDILGVKPEEEPTSYFKNFYFFATIGIDPIRCLLSNGARKIKEKLKRSKTNRCKYTN